MTEPEAIDEEVPWHLAGNYAPGFTGKLFHKDLRIALAALAEAGVPAASSAVAAQLVQAQMAAGRGDEDYSALGDVIFQLAHARE